MENTEQETTKKLQAGVQMEPDLFAIVDRIRIEEDRSMSNTIAVLLKTHPRVRAMLEGEPATA